MRKSSQMFFEKNDMHDVQWSNNRIMEFLVLYQTEPCLWDPREESYKSRVAQIEAWQRIVQRLQFPSTIKELKRKKDSLMAYYRNHLNKYKKSLISGAEASNVYSTSWFAFDLMHSFLRPVYVDNKMSFETSNIHSSESETSGLENSCADGSPATKPILKCKYQGFSRQALKRPINSSFGHCNFEGQDSSSMSLQGDTPEKQNGEAFHCVNQQSSYISTQGLDEYDHFALMIAAKIRKINNIYERETVMNTIQNMVFQSIMKNKDVTYQSENLPPEYWEPSSNEPAVENDTKANIPLYFSSSDTPRSPSLGSE